NSKFSAAWRRRSRSGKCSGPNLVASMSSERIELVLRTSCQVSMTASSDTVGSIGRIHHGDTEDTEEQRGKPMGDSAPTKSLLIEPRRCAVDHQRFSV